ncbi:WhiB family transcriptional regulator [Streptomyces prasinopilosus]|uniref:WhiB family transcriptional regulator n=1 Tax=Streptomyces prasinopilosus TaxID=67344 RepID=UPI0006EB6861|nr:WhiB family transcriptional regulator [Streptomyces prasinopilosus]
MTDSIALRRAWEKHPHFRYRGCAPDVDQPSRAAGDTALSLDAWHGEDLDGGEPQRVREARQAAAVEVCLNCPVMVQCDAYANSVVVEGGKARLAEPDGIWGGRLALERHRAFIRRRHEVAAQAPVRQMRTPQRLRVLEALAVHAEAEAVAQAAGVDVRTANWQRSRLVTQLNLDKGTATRRELLAAAVDQGLLDESVVVADDGTVPAVPPPVPSSGSSPSSRPAPSAEAVPSVEVPGASGGLSSGSVPAVGRLRASRPRRGRRSRVTIAGPGQLPLFDTPPPSSSAPVVSLRSVPVSLGAAA